MYKLSVPISMNTLNDKSIFEYIELAEKCQAERIFICGQNHFYKKDSNLYVHPEKLRKYINIFRENGFEVGVWLTGFGHGVPLTHQTDVQSSPYTQIEGINGEVGNLANCPLDPDFAHDYAEGIRQIAELAPDMIMIDDDFRLNGRQGYHFGCFCHRHLKEYYKRLGEQPPREKLEALMFTGGKNKYRSAYLALAGDVMLNFAKNLRQTVDSVDPTIRLGVCGTNELWDFCGTDMIELSKVLAGNTKPFARTVGAPYWWDNTILVIEASRQQFAWAKDTGIELFAEGDTYPRPRYNLPSKLLELFELTLCADGTSDGLLAYVFDYTYRPEYETGYVERYARNRPIRKKIGEIFSGKKAVGLEVYNRYHKAENFEFPDGFEKKYAVNKLMHGIVPPSRTIICGNSIPTAFEECGYPVFLVGENARYIEREKLKNGAVLDASAAEILRSRGIDVGLISSARKAYAKEHFERPNETVIGISAGGQTALVCDERATVHSRYLPDNVVASYTYENSEGERFYVLGYNHIFMTSENVNYMNNYHRQSDLVFAIEWLCGKKLPAVALKHPRLYILASNGEEGMAVSLSNVFLDDVYDCEIQLDKAYSEIKFVNCSGKLVDDKVYISWIPPYGFAAFEVK